MLTAEKLLRGGVFLTTLSTFPLFCAYMLMVLCARWWRKVASPLDLRPLMIIYNFVTSAANLYTVAGFFYGLTQAESSFQRSRLDLLLPVFKVYWLLKIFELLDTVFMILRHKFRQISFLHVYHHASMLILSDFACNVYAYPAFASYLGLNSIVHVVLYLYYGLYAMYPDNPPQWKKQLTIFQILQFLVDLVHGTIGYLYHGYCVYSILYGLTMVGLFSNFYYQAYVKVRNPKLLQNGIGPEDKKLR